MIYKKTWKYILVRDKGIALFRVKALKNFKDVSRGSIGGFVEGYRNLSQKGNCWIFGNARIFDDACISENAIVLGNVWIYDYSQIYGNAIVKERASVYGNAQVYGNAMVSKDAKVYGDAQVFGNAIVTDNAWVHGKTKISRVRICNSKIVK